jgi:hypothetical protein
MDRAQVNWWNSALYDTCSLITIDKILLDHPEMELHFHEILAIEHSFSSDQMLPPTINRMRPRVNLIELPSINELWAIFEKWPLSNALAETDKLVFAAAIHHKHRVVTADRGLAKALRKAQLKVGNCAMILQYLVIHKVLTPSKCDAILASLIKRKDFILPPDLPQNWTTLKSYKFI